MMQQRRKNRSYPKAGKVLSTRRGNCSCGWGVDVKVIQTTATEKPVVVMLCDRCDWVRNG